MSVVDLATPSLLISDLQQGSVVSFAAWIVVGLLVGFIGSRAVNKTGHGLVRDVLLGILGAIFGGFLANLLGESHTAGLDRYSLLVAAVGAVVFLIVYSGMVRDSVHQDYHAFIPKIKHRTEPARLDSESWNRADSHQGE